MTECLGGSMELSEEQLGLRYQVCMTRVSSSHLLTSYLSGALRVSATPV